MAELLNKKDDPTATQLLERRVRELSTLHEIARAVTSVLDLEVVLNRIVEAAVYLTNAEEGFLLLVDEATGDLVLRAGKGLGDKAARVMGMKVTDSIAGQVVRTGRPVRMGGFRRDEEYKVKTGYLVKSLVNVPIKSGGRVIGVLSVDHSIASLRTFSDHDVALLSSLADYAAIAIENARLFAQASAKAGELATALEEQTGLAPAAPSPAQDRQALEQFVQGLRAQREEITRGVERARDLAQNLRSQADGADEMVERLSLWNDEVLSLIPQLEWLAQVGLPHAAQATPPAAEPVLLPQEAGVPAPDSRFLEHLAEGVLLCDAQGVIRQANEAAAEILGKALTDLVNADLQSAADDERWSRMVGSLRLALALGGETRLAPMTETTLYFNDRTVHANLIPITNSAAKIAGVIAIFRDISPKVGGWRARDEALTAISQKLRSPMTAIASYSDLLLSDAAGVTDPMQRRYLQRIRHGVQRIETILRELSDETAAASQSLETSTQSVSDVINEAIDTAQDALFLDGVNIARDIPETLPPVQFGAQYVSRILADLLAAAGKRTAVGHSVNVDTQVQWSDGWPTYLVVLIQDGGALPEGVPPLEEDTAVHDARALAEEEGGRIWVEPKAEGGNLLSFLLPVAEVASPGPVS
jgi:PAS domain S-box-containing protein